MSHIVQIKTEVRDALAVQAACQRLGLEAPVLGTVTLFATEASGLLVRLTGWIYPVVFDTRSGQVRFDNYGGRWGEQVQLDQFLQAYAVGQARTLYQARRSVGTSQCCVNE